MRHQDVSKDSAARVLIFSMRNITSHVSRCVQYEFEDAISSVDSAEIIAPRVSGRHTSTGVTRYLQRLWGNESPPVELDVPKCREQEYDLYFAVCARPQDLRFVEVCAPLRQRCARSVCLITEAWLDETEKLRPFLPVLAGFDHLVSNLESGVSLIERMTGRPCQFLPPAVDALKFCPYPGTPPRSIDVYSMGRRPTPVHEALIRLSARDGCFYVYDTVANFEVIDPAEHRALLANLVKRSRYFIAFPPQFENPTRALQPQLGFRFFEGAAGGAVMLGAAPKCAASEACFDWPDAVIPISMDAKTLPETIASLDREPERLAGIRRSNIVNSLLRHDWVYRWRQVLETAGMPISPGVADRQRELRVLAEVAGTETPVPKASARNRVAAGS